MRCSIQTHLSRNIYASQAISTNFLLNAVEWSRNSNMRVEVGGISGPAVHRSSYRLTGNKYSLWCIELLIAFDILHMVIPS